MRAPFKPEKIQLLGPSVLGRYRRLPWGLRSFLKLRWIWTPYEEMASLFPLKGRILDGGCGHGLLSLTLALQSPPRRVLGLDHSKERVACAVQAAQGLKNLSFKIGNYTSPPPGPYDGIALIDVLHYLSYEEQTKVIRAAFRSLRRGGILVFREVDRTPGLSSYLNRFHEAVMTGLGFTKAGGLHFRGDPDWKKLAEEAGFKVESKSTARFPFADILYWGRKP